MEGKENVVSRDMVNDQSHMGEVVIVMAWVTWGGFGGLRGASGGGGAKEDEMGEVAEG